MDNEKTSFSESDQKRWTLSLAWLGRSVERLCTAVTPGLLRQPMVLKSQLKVTGRALVKRCIRPKSKSDTEPKQQAPGVPGVRAHFSNFVVSEEVGYCFESILCSHSAAPSRACMCQWQAAGLTQGSNVVMSVQQQRGGLFWRQVQVPWSRNTGLGSSRFHVPMWKQFYRNGTKKNT